jgi:DNA polymerase III delta prime subunit
MGDGANWKSFFSPAYWVYLKKWARSSHIEPPLLLRGKNLAQLTAASELIALLNMCENAAEEPCRTCQTCTHVLRNSHPDISTVGREQYAGGGMEALRVLRKDFSRSALHGRRLIVLKDVDALSLPALNALLKSLEEPHARLRYVLTSRNPGRLPQTIHSRCSHIQLKETSRASEIDGQTIQRLDNFTQRMLSARTEAALSSEVLAYIADRLSAQLRQSGPTPELRLAFYRLRDYCHVVAIKGNEKLAREVLFASLPELTHTTANI